jgi:hypothetical protein
MTNNQSNRHPKSGDINVERRSIGRAKPGHPIDHRLPKDVVPLGADGRIDHFVVCRESCMHGHLLMEGMIGQTVGRLLHLPGAADVLAAGTKPLTGGGPFKVQVLRSGKNQAVMFDHRGVGYLYSLGSAATANIGDQENAFVELLCEAIEAFRPRNLYVATFSRLVRSTDFSGKLYRVVKNDVDTVHYGSQTLTPTSVEGKIMWTMLSLMADMERDLIVQRLFAGTCNKFQKGQWILGPDATPPGYRVDKTTGVLTLVPESVDAVRTLLELMADPKLPSRDVLDSAGRLGLTSGVTKRFHGSDATFEDLRRADSKLASIVDWIPAYETGRHEFRFPNPFPGATHIGSLPVEDANGTNSGYVKFAYDLELPHGGWGAPDILAAAKKRCRGGRERRETGGAAHIERKPFAGRVEWTANQIRYRISGDGTNYIVFREPTDIE